MNVKALRLLIVSACALCIFNVKLFCQTNGIDLQKITDHLYIISGAGGNVAFFVTETGVLVIDSGNKPDNEKNILNKIHEVTEKPIKYLVFTHYHGDHILGAQNFPESTIIISHENTRINIKNVFIDNKSTSNFDNPMNTFPLLIKNLEQKIENLKAEKNP